MAARSWRYEEDDRAPLHYAIPTLVDDTDTVPVRVILKEIAQESAPAPTRLSSDYYIQFVNHDFEPLAGDPEWPFKNGLEVNK